jgi:hypothetical protein
MTIRFSVVYELTPSEWEELLLPDQVPITWKAEVVTMGGDVGSWIRRPVGNPVL